MAIPTTDIVIFALIVILLGRRLIRNRNGARYSVGSIFMTPVIYTLLTMYFVIGLTVPQAAGLIVAIIAGIAAGLVLGKRSEIFQKDGKTMYRRSTEVMALWLVGFVIRVGIDFFYNPALSVIMSGGSLNATTTLAISAYEQSPIIFGADLLLAFSAGLLLGEAIVLYKKHGLAHAVQAKHAK